MKKFLCFFIFLIIISMGFILYVRIDPYNENVYKIVKDKFYRKFMIRINSQELEKIFIEKGFIIKSIKRYPWSLKVSWEEEYTWIHILSKSKEYFINQKCMIMKNIKRHDNTITVKDYNNLPIKDIVLLIKSFGSINIKEVELFSKYFVVYSDDKRILFDYKNYKENLKDFKTLFKELNAKYFDFRFSIPVIRG